MRYTSERLFLEELAEAGRKTKIATRGLPIGALIKMIRVQLGMSQKVLCKRAKIPPSTLSRIEKEKTVANLATLQKILQALFCDLVLIPMMTESIETIRRKQARKRAESHIRYLKGTMSLEQQQPDSRLLSELLKQEEERILHARSSELWEE